MSNNSQPLMQPAITKFDRPYKWLHWSMAFLMMLMLFGLLGFASVQTEQEHKEMLVGHSSIGLVITVLMLIRVFKRFVKRDPVPQHDIPQWQQTLSKAVQCGLYFSMVFLPLSGILTARAHELPVMAFGSIQINAGGAYDEALFTTLRQLHEFGINLFIVLLILHIVGAVYHRLVRKDQVLASMTMNRSSQEIP